MADVTIEARPNGPYMVTGTIELRDTNGNIMPPRPGPCSVAAVHPQKAFLRWHPLEDRIPGCGRSGARFSGKNLKEISRQPLPGGLRVGELFGSAMGHGQSCPAHL